VTAPRPLAAAWVGYPPRHRGWSARPQGAHPRASPPRAAGRSTS